MPFWEDVNVRMRRAVQQESDSMTAVSLSTKTSKGRTSHRSSGRRGAVFVWVILLSPVLVVLVMIYLGQVYKVIYQQEEQAHHHDVAASAAASGAASVAAIRMQNDRDDHRQEQQILRKRKADMARLEARTTDEHQPSPDAKGVGEEAHQDHDNNDHKFHPPPRPEEAHNVLVLTTSHGPIRIQMRRDLSEGSVHYLEQLVQSQVCPQCHFYRAEAPGILQGIVQNKAIPLNDGRGPCPSDVTSVKNDCPEWDPDCGCHGPLMSRGAVAWAGGMAFCAK